MANHSSIIDDGAKFQIIPNTRRIVVPQSHKTIGTVGDHNSEQLTFQCPKTIDGHDIAKCSDKYISWTNAAGTDGSFDITDVVTDDENIYFPWLIDSNVTAAAGAVSFSVHFEDKANGALLYHWGTTTCNDCQILDTKNHKKTVGAIPDGYIRPAGTVTYNANGNYDVSKYARAIVNVEATGGTVPVIPEGFIKPEGTITINKNGTFDVKSYESAVVNTPQMSMLFLDVTENGTYEAAPNSGYSIVRVNVAGGGNSGNNSGGTSGGITPSGTINIIENGIVNVANFELANVQVVPKVEDLTVTANGGYQPVEGYFGTVTVAIPEYDGEIEINDVGNIIKAGTYVLRADGVSAHEDGDFRQDLPIGGGNSLDISMTNGRLALTYGIVTAYPYEEPWNLDPETFLQARTFTVAEDTKVPYAFAYWFNANTELKTE